jgi:glutamine transport system permease protein
VEIWSAVAVIYLCMIGTLTFGLRTMEKRMRML